MLTREQVYDKINVQADFFVSHFGLDDSIKTPPLPASVEEWLDFMRCCHHNTLRTFGSIDNELAAMVDLAAAAVMCMKKHGAVTRHSYNPGTSMAYPRDRKEVFSVIDGERAYQNSLGADRASGEPHGVSGYKLMIDQYLRAAIDGWVKSAGNHEALNNLRKVAAVCVRCLEEHGA